MKHKSGRKKTNAVKSFDKKILKKGGFCGIMLQITKKEINMSKELYSI